MRAENMTLERSVLLLVLTLAGLYVLPLSLIHI